MTYLDELEALREAMLDEAETATARGRREAAERLAMGLWRYRDALLRDARRLQDVTAALHMEPVNDVEPESTAPPEPFQLELVLET